jgi:hypothetical protein
MRDDDNLIKLCAAEFQAHVTELFDQAEKKALRALARGDTKVRAPVTGFWYDSWDEQSTERAKRLACNALGAQAWHAKHAPPWAVPLPVSLPELEKELDRSNPRERLRHEFGLSLRSHDWDFTRHPAFPPWACTVMGGEFTPEFIKSDRGLRAEFLPQPLVKLSGFCWLSPEMIARAKALEAFHEKLHSGASHDEARREGRRVYAASLQHSA